MLWLAFEEKSLNFKHFINQVCLTVLILTENTDIFQADTISEAIMALFSLLFFFYHQGSQGMSVTNSIYPNTVLLVNWKDKFGDIIWLVC